MPVRVHMAVYIHSQGFQESSNNTITPQPPALVGDHPLLRRLNYHQEGFFLAPDMGTNDLGDIRAAKSYDKVPLNTTGTFACHPLSRRGGLMFKLANQGGIHAQPVS